MQIYSNSRRNFLNSVAILSAGTVFKPTVKNIPFINEQEDLQEKWDFFSRISGGKKIYSYTDLPVQNNLFDTKGHQYKTGELIYFSKENILAQPVWIYWGTNAKPVDVVITLFEKSDLLKKITRVNRFDLDALYKLSKDYDKDKLLTAFCNSLKSAFNQSSLVKNKITITKKLQAQQVSYYKKNELIINKKFIYHA
jgi:hypothetical protein